MIEVHLYGKLRDHSDDYARNGAAVIHLASNEGETLSVLLERMGISQIEINHIFYNSKLLVTRTKHAILYDFPMTGASLDDWDLDVVLNPGDRLGLFGMDIPILSM